MTMWHEIGRQLRHPSGRSGKLVGSLMQFANRRPTNLAVEALDIGPGDVVLDLGCGTGDAVALMAARAGGGHVHGLDHSKIMLERAAQRNRAAIGDGRVSLACGRFERLPYADATFDGIVASNVMYFWKDSGLVLDELHRVLRPRGRLVIYVTDAKVMQRWKFAGPDTHRLYDAKSLRETLARGGFETESLAAVRISRLGRANGLLAIARPACRSLRPTR